MTVLAVSFGALCGGPVGDPLLVDGMTANATDSLVLDAAGCENEAQTKSTDVRSVFQGVSPHFQLILQEV
jgi:hypothetical protein